MTSRAWLIAGLAVTAAMATNDAAGPLLVFDFDCADPATYPTGKVSVDLDPEAMQLGGKAWNDRAVSFDLNRDGKPEFFVPTFCGATGNCDWAVFAVEPSRSLGKISGDRIYVDDAGDPWFPITAYISSGAGHGFVSVYRMSGSAYSEVSSAEIQDPENGQFLEGSGEPFCRAESAKSTRPTVGSDRWNPDPACPFSAPLPSSDVLIGYIGEVHQSGTTRIGSFRALGVLRNGALLASDGAAIRDGMEFWKVLAPATPPTALKNASSFVDGRGADRCVFHSDLEEDLPPWTLLSSRPLPDSFRPPDASDSSHFADHHNVCVDQGDYEPSEKPPCSRPRLLAVSDLNRDGAEEYWATEPYLWDTGITVWQRTETGLTEILAVCTACSD